MAWDDVSGKAAGNNGDKYVVLQVVLTEKLLGTGSGTASLTNLQSEINKQAAKGYRLHTISTTSSGSKGFLGGDKIQATMVFERIDRVLLKISRMHFPMHSGYFSLSISSPADTPASHSAPLPASPSVSRQRADCRLRVRRPVQAPRYSRRPSSHPGCAR